MIPVLKTPYLLFLGSARTPTDAETAMGIAYWRTELCCGQLRLPGCEASTGLPDLTLESARARGARSFVIGVAPWGGQLDPTWLDVIRQAAGLGYDIVSGMHTRLGSSRCAQLSKAKCVIQVTTVRGSEPSPFHEELRVWD